MLAKCPNAVRVMCLLKIGKQNFSDVPPLSAKPALVPLDKFKVSSDRPHHRIQNPSPAMFHHGKSAQKAMVAPQNPIISIFSDIGPAWPVPAFVRPDSSLPIGLPLSMRFLAE